MITRTFTVNTFNAMVVNTATAEVENREMVILECKEKDIKQRLNDEIFDPDEIVVKYDLVESKEVLMGIPEEMFFEIGTILPPRNTQSL